MAACCPGNRRPKSVASLAKAPRMQQRWLLHPTSGPDFQEGNGVCPDALPWIDAQLQRTQRREMTRIIPVLAGVWWWDFLTLQVTPALPAAKTAHVKTSAVLSLLPAPFCCPGQWPGDWVGAVNLPPSCGLPQGAPWERQAVLPRHSDSEPSARFSRASPPPQSY